MTPDELRVYLADPARDGNPAIRAARELLADRDRLKAAVGDLLDRQAAFIAVTEERDDLRAGYDPLLREVERLRQELDARIHGTWEEPE